MERTSDVVNVDRKNGMMMRGVRKMNLYTSYFARQKKMEMEDTAYISIAVGNPRYAVPYEIVNLPELKPYGIFKKYHGEEFREKYFERLDSFGVDRIWEAIQKAVGGHKNAVLMCHEKDENQCHRSMFAEWWLMNTGEIIPEFGKEEKSQYKQLTMF